MVNTIPVHSAMAITIPENGHYDSKNFTMAIIPENFTMANDSGEFYNGHYFSNIFYDGSNILHSVIFPTYSKTVTTILANSTHSTIQHILPWAIIFQHILQWLL
ncbi:hypothetical protein CEXT_740931 [Caerostris extrusa]|uniref:Uncharacterized protein n=1 Tax=Caerostris extrusa TaxID=172846 RepID=A0AAV4XNS6_CAEEX|nr:hypothetical protein CEXT_740931 [Caerostris extrusa]